MLYNLYLVSVLFSAPSLRAKFSTENLFTLVSFIICVPQAKTFIMNDNMAGQFNRTTLAVNSFAFFVAPHACMSPLEADDEMLFAVTL